MSYYYIDGLFRSFLMYIYNLFGCKCPASRIISSSIETSHPHNAPLLSKDLCSFTLFVSVMPSIWMNGKTSFILDALICHFSTLLYFLSSLA